MTNQQHPITPPPELCGRWYDESPYDDELGLVEHVATQAARWGADQELNECCKWLPKLPPWSADDLRKHRRPKPPSLKEQALESVKRFEESGEFFSDQMRELEFIRKALEQFND